MTSDGSDDQLSAADNEEIFRAKIVPKYLAEAPSQRHPTVVIIGGQTGAGKTEVTRMVRHAFGRDDSGRDAFVHIDMDEFNPHHPKFAIWQAKDETMASRRVRPDGDRWWQQAQEYAIEHRKHVVLESAMRDPSEFEQIAERFNRAGYKVEVALVAVAAPTSRLGALDRYWEQLQHKGRGRLVDPAVHDQCYEGVLRGARAVDAGGLAHSAFAFRRNGEIVYANFSADSRTWQRMPRLAAAVDTERRRPFSSGEEAFFTRRMSALRKAMDRKWAPELDSIQALAEPHLPAGTPSPASPTVPAQRQGSDVVPVPLHKAAFPTTTRAAVARAGADEAKTTSAIAPHQQAGVSRPQQSDRARGDAR